MDEKSLYTDKDLRSARFLTEEQAADLEKTLVADPDSYECRTKLLVYYFQTQFYSRHNQMRQAAHAEWLIENFPDIDIAGSPYAQITKGENEELHGRLKQAWQKILESKGDDPQILINAAHFFFNGEKELAEQCILKAIEKTEPEYTSDIKDMKKWLSHLYRLWDGHEEQAFLLLNELGQNCDQEERCYILTDLPLLAFNAGHFERAAEAAEQLLELAPIDEGWNCGNAINAAHTTLGRLALATGDIDKAIDHLEQSIINVESPQTKSFGPPLDLANELAEAGQKEAVLDFLNKREQLCGLTHRNAFEIRYFLETGTRIKFSGADSSLFDKAYRDHQYERLSSLNFGDRIYHLEKVIEGTRSSIKILQRFLDDNEGDDEKTARYQQELQEDKEHLARLENLRE
jgi:hypothetical protein